jgi:hypothetical protein
MTYFEEIEYLSVVPEVHDDAVGLTYLGVSPHMTSRESVMRATQPKLRADGFETAPLVGIQGAGG